MEEAQELDAQLCRRYKIKRPPYEAADLEELTRRMEEEFPMHSDWNLDWLKEQTLVRFLKAFLTVSDTVKALVEYFDWRLTEKADVILTVDVNSDEGLSREKSKKRENLFFEHTDRCGRPILVVNVRCHDRYHNDYDSLFRYSMYCLEMLAAVADQKSFDQRLTLIFNLEGFGMSNMDYNFVKTSLHYLRCYYPERIAQCFIINYPWIFHSCWKLIQYWMNDITRSKFIFAGKQQVNDFIDLDTLPMTLFREK